MLRLSLYKATLLAASGALQVADVVAAQHHRPDPRKRTPGGPHQIGIPAGFRSESVAGFLSECMAGFLGARSSFLIPRIKRGFYESAADP